MLLLFLKPHVLEDAVVTPEVPTDPRGAGSAGDDGYILRPQREPVPERQRESRLEAVRDVSKVEDKPKKPAKQRRVFKEPEVVLKRPRRLPVPRASLPAPTPAPVIAPRPAPSWEEIGKIARAMAEAKTRQAELVARVEAERFEAAMAAEREQQKVLAERVAARAAIHAAIMERDEEEAIIATLLAAI